MKTRHLMLHGCMLEYLKGKTHEQEVEGLPSVGYQRSIFCNKFMISFKFLVCF